MMLQIIESAESVNDKNFHFDNCGDFMPMVYFTLRQCLCDLLSGGRRPSF